MISRMETPDHWITYCEATEGNVANADKKTAVHRRKVSSCSLRCESTGRLSNDGSMHKANGHTDSRVSWHLAKLTGRLFPADIARLAASPSCRRTSLYITRLIVCCRSRTTTELGTRGVRLAIRCRVDVMRLAPSP